MGSRQVDCKCYMRSCYHIIPEKWFVLFWMCDFIALTRCCKLISSLHLMCIYTPSYQHSGGLYICHKRQRAYHMTVCAAAQHCCKGDERFQWEMSFFRVFQLQNPWTDFQKILRSWLRQWPHPTRKYLDQSAQRGCVCACVKLSSSGVYFFSLMLIATGLPIGPIIAVDGLNGVFWWHSHSLYGLVKKNWNLLPLTPKIWKFALRPMATLKSHNSGTVKDTCKICAPNWGVFGVGQSNGIIQIC